jgi:hypothetical protein
VFANVPVMFCDKGIERCVQMQFCSHDTQFTYFCFWDVISFVIVSVMIINKGATGGPAEDGLASK